MRVHAKTLLKGLILVVCVAVMLPRPADGWYGAAGLQDHPVHAGQLNAMEA